MTTPFFLQIYTLFFNKHKLAGKSIVQSSCSVAGRGGGGIRGRPPCRGTGHRRRWHRRGNGNRLAGSRERRCIWPIAAASARGCRVHGVSRTSKRQIRC